MRVGSARNIKVFRDIHKDKIHWNRNWPILDSVCAKYGNVYEFWIQDPISSVVSIQASVRLITLYLLELDLM